MKKFLKNIKSLLSKIKVVHVIIVWGILIVYIHFFPLWGDIVHNQIRLMSLEKQTEAYSHPPDSKLVQRHSIIGNFAPVSYECGFLIVEERTTMLQPDDISMFYAPTLKTPSYDHGPPYHEVTLFFLKDEKDVENIKQMYPQMNGRITHKAIADTRAYVLITAQIERSNKDKRCHKL